MKKIKNILAVALIALTGFISLVAMKPMREKFPELGINPNPPIVQESCVGCPEAVVVKIINNSRCKKIKAILGFTASQIDATGNPVTSGIFTIDPIILSPLIPFLDITKVMIDPHVTSPINTSQTYTLPTGGIDIYASDYTTVLGNILPGEINKRVPKLDAQGNGPSGRCECYIVSWDIATNTITINDCQ
ncbi:MAG: hypothetical protein ACEQSR_12040 [Candidatus Methylacidiphilales bacterium]